MLDSIEMNQPEVRTSWDHSCTEPPWNGYMVQINGRQFTMIKRLPHYSDIPIRSPNWTSKWTLEKDCRCSTRRSDLDDCAHTYLQHQLVPFIGAVQVSNPAIVVQCMELKHWTAGMKLPLILVGHHQTGGKVTYIPWAFPYSHDVIVQKWRFQKTSPPEI